MTAGTLNLVVEQGATWRPPPVRLMAGSFDPARPQDLSRCAVQDLSGCAARAQVRRAYADPLPLLDLTTTNGGIAIDADQWISISATAAQTAALPVPAVVSAPWVWDLEVTYPDGSVERVLQGTIVLSPAVTR